MIDFEAFESTLIPPKYGRPPSVQNDEYRLIAGPDVFIVDAVEHDTIANEAPPSEINIASESIFADQLRVRLVDAQRCVRQCPHG